MKRYIFFLLLIILLCFLLKDLKYVENYLDISDKHKEILDSIQKIQDENPQLQSDIATLQDQSVKLTNKFKNLTTDYNNVTTLNRSQNDLIVSQENQDFNDKVATCKRELLKWHSKYDDISRQLGDYRSETLELLQRATACVGQKNDLENKLKSIQDQLNNAYEKLSTAKLYYNK
jgi:chromosome segregation ATPase